MNTEVVDSLFIMTDDQDRNIFDILKAIEDQLKELKVDIRGDGERGIPGLIKEKSIYRDKFERRIRGLEEKAEALGEEVDELRIKVNEVHALPSNLKYILGIISLLVGIIGGIIIFWNQIKAHFNFIEL